MRVWLRFGLTAVILDGGFVARQCAVFVQRWKTLPTALRMSPHHFSIRMRDIRNFSNHNLQLSVYLRHPDMVSQSQNSQRRCSSQALLSLKMPRNVRGGGFIVPCLNPQQRDAGQLDRDGALKQNHGSLYLLYPLYAPLPSTRTNHPEHNMPIPRRDSRFLEALPQDIDHSSISENITTASPSSTSPTPSSSSMTGNTSNPSTKSPNTPPSRLKRKLHDMIFGKPPPLSSEGWVLRPDLLFEMQKAVGKSGEDVRRDLAREMAGRDAADGKGKRPTSAAEVEALMLRVVE